MGQVKYCQFCHSYPGIMMLFDNRRKEIRYVCRFCYGAYQDIAPTPLSDEIISSTHVWLGDLSV
jgi:hypothetical protein